MTGSTVRGVPWADGAAAGPRVLWIDDDLSVLSYASSFLPSEGFPVDVAVDGRGGLARARERDYDVIVLDLRLPESSGIDILAGLRQSGIATPVVVLTGFPDTDSALAAGHLGVDAYHAKPLIGSALVAALRTAAQTSHLAGVLAATRWPAPTSHIALLHNVDELLSRSVLEHNSPRRSGKERRLAGLLARALGNPDLTLLEFVAVAGALRSVTVGSEPFSTIGPRLRQSLEWASLRDEAAPDPRIARLLERLCAAGARPGAITADELRVELKLDRRSLWRLLQTQLGLSFRQCRQAIVIRQAVQALANTDEQVAQIAFQIGYQHANQFDRDFHRLLGLTPTRHRQLLSPHRSQRGVRRLSQLFRKV